MNRPNAFAAWPLAVLLALASPLLHAQSDDALEVLEQAVANTRSMLLGEGPVDAAYLQSVETDNGDERQARVFRIDTRKPWEDQVELVEIDGQPADPEARETYHAERLERIEEARAAAAHEESEDEEQAPGTTISLADFDTREARLIERQPGRMRFELPHGAAAMASGGAAEMAEHLTMEVSVVTEGAAAPYIDHIRAFNEKPFKPGLIGKVKRFEMEFEFAFNEQPRLLLITAMNVTLRAKALFKSIQSDQRVAYTDYRFFAVETEAGGSEAGLGDQ